MTGKYVEHNEIVISNSIYKYLHGLSEKGIITEAPECEMCNGTGLQGVTEFSEGGFSWDGRFCELCKGTGFKQSCYDGLLFVCPICKGGGCGNCNNTGIVDWVENLRSIK